MGRGWLGSPRVRDGQWQTAASPPREGGCRYLMSMARQAVRFRRPAAFRGLLFCAAVFAGPLVAGESRGKITVEAAGTVSVRPDVAEVRTAVTGNATMAADAVKKFRDNRRRAFELIHKSGLKGLVIEGRGPLITSNVANNQQQAGIFFGNMVVQANQQTS